MTMNQKKRPRAIAIALALERVMHRLRRAAYGQDVRGAQRSVEGLVR